MSKKILVTGSEGYIGKEMCKTIEKSGYSVVRFDSVLGDNILDIEGLIRKAVDCETIIHLAGVVGMKAVEIDPEWASRINVEGTRNVVACNKDTIMPGVTANYNGAKIIDEETPMSGEHPYFAQKIETEKMILCSGGKVLRLGTLYGISETMRSDLLVHNLIKESLFGKIDVFQPYYRRAITSLKDVVAALLFFATSKNSNGLYNVVSWNLDKIEIAGMIAEISGAEICVVADEDSEDRNYFVKTDKIRSLGFSFSDNLKEELKGLFNFYKESKNE